MPLTLAPAPRTRWAMLSTYPPTACGVATFAQALVRAMEQAGATVDVVRLLDSAQGEDVEGVVHEWSSEPDSARATVDVLNRYDVVVVQHEFGIYPGPDGEELLDVLGSLLVPVVSVLHTVLAEPTAHQRQVLEEVIAASTVAVTMTHAARDRVVAQYGGEPDQVVVIPHGAPHAVTDGLGYPPAGEPDRRPVVLTWGLLGPGKGIEWGIEAMGALRELDPRPLYVVAGRTHPKVAAHEGERYRRFLEARVADLGLESDVVFVDRYLAAEDLHRIVLSADVVLLPYDSEEQVTSGVLVEAVAAGRPVVSTPFPHAVELLQPSPGRRSTPAWADSKGAGMIVGRRCPDAIAGAVRRLLVEPGLAQSLSRQASRLAPTLSWHAVADRYLEIGDVVEDDDRAARLGGAPVSRT